MEQHFSAATYSAILIEKITEQSLFGTFEFKYENQNHDHNHDYNHNILFIQVKNLFSKMVVVISRGPVVLYLSSYIHVVLLQVSNLVGDLVFYCLYT